MSCLVVPGVKPAVGRQLAVVDGAPVVLDAAVVVVDAEEVGVAAGFALELHVASPMAAATITVTVDHLPERIRAAYGLD
jgi:hypothetical protein